MKYRTPSYGFGMFILPLLLACTSCSKKSKPGIHTIEIKQMKFQPEELSVQKGDTVVFTNYDMVNHDITEAAAKKWSSSILAPEHSWKMVVTQNSDYYCSIHPVMKGRIRIR